MPDDAPDRTVVPATPDLESLLANYKSSVTIEHGEVFDPSPANIESRLTRVEAGERHEGGDPAQENRKQQRRWRQSSCGSAMRSTLKGQNRRR